MQSWKNSRLAAGMLCTFLIAAVGCHSSLSGGRAKARLASSGPTHRLQGVVLGKSAELNEITVHQGVIPDFEPAMNAVYKISNPTVMRRLEPGDQITGEVIPAEDFLDNRLANVEITGETRPGADAAALPPHLLLQGEQVPQIPMVDQDGRRVDFQKYLGKAVLITFIDSKCTDDCPIITRHFQRVNTLLAADPGAFAASHLISISIDPANDTPPVLRKYGLGYMGGKAAGFSHWQFVDLTPDNLKRLATAFGVNYYPSHGDIDHNMQTALIGPDGRLVRVWAGDEWNPAVLAKAVEAAATQSGTA